MEYGSFFCGLLLLEETSPPSGSPNAQTRHPKSKNDFCFFSFCHLIPPKRHENDQQKSKNNFSQGKKVRIFPLTLTLTLIFTGYNRVLIVTKQLGTFIMSSVQSVRTIFHVFARNIFLHIPSIHFQHICQISKFYSTWSHIRSE